MFYEYVTLSICMYVEGRTTRQPDNGADDTTAAEPLGVGYAGNILTRQYV